MDRGDSVSTWRVVELDVRGLHRAVHRIRQGRERVSRVGSREIVSHA
jgi:hypothetical protein